MVLYLPLMHAPLLASDLDMRACCWSLKDSRETKRRLRFQHLQYISEESPEVLFLLLRWWVAVADGARILDLSCIIGSFALSDGLSSVRCIWMCG